MTGAKRKNSTATAKRELIALPKWVPPSVAWQVRRIEDRDLPSEQRVILCRLATDERMRKVWTLFISRNRQTGQFTNPAKLMREKPPSVKQDEVQAKALADIFHFAFCAARDRPAVSKPGDVEREKQTLIEKAKILRGLAQMVEVSDFTAEQAVSDEASRQLAIADAAALERVARWLEHVASAMRPPRDPLMVQNHRGDPVVRGVQIVIADQLRKAFGSVHHRTAATLTSVALAQETTDKVTRTAFSDRKLPKKGRLRKAKKKR